MNERITIKYEKSGYEVELQFFVDDELIDTWRPWYDKPEEFNIVIEELEIVVE